MYRTILLITASLLAFNASAAWTLDNDNSAIAFVSVKNGSVVESHAFTSLSGNVGDAGNARVDIDLASVDTGIPVRDERVRKLLFDVTNFPSASFNASVPMAQVKALKVGEGMDYTLSGVLSLHGKDVRLEIPVLVLRAGESTIAVSTRKPVIIHAGDFDLENGIEALRGIAKLKAITPGVPVSFTLVFHQSK